MIPEAINARCGSPPTGCSTLTTSAPQSAMTAPAAGTKVHAATSSTRTPDITLCMAVNVADYDADVSFVTTAGSSAREWITASGSTSNPDERSLATHTALRPACWAPQTSS